MLDCLKVRKMVRNKVMPAGGVAVYTIPLESGDGARRGGAGLDSDGPAAAAAARAGGFKSSQFDAEFSSAREARSEHKRTSTEEERGNLHPKSHAAMKSRGRGLLCYLALDVPILLVVATVVALLELGYIPFNRSGFYCKDKSLDFKFIKDTVSMEVIMLTTILLPFVVIWPVEAALHRPAEYSLKSRRWWDTLKSTSCLYREYMYGMFVNLIIVEVMKMTIGNPRPTFFDICEPNVNCTAGEYVSEFSCTSTRYGRWFQLDASRSFPSGHTSLSVYCGLFIAWYLQRRTFSWRNPSVFLVPLLQMSCIAYAVICSLTRITDHRHHWWDVLAGAVVGFVVLLYTVVVLCKNFACSAAAGAASSSDISSSDAGGHNHHSVRRLLSSGSAEHAPPHAHIAHVP